MTFDPTTWRLVAKRNFVVARTWRILDDFGGYEHSYRDCFSAMTATESVLAFNAFEKQLRGLCLREFPCGLGSWRDSKATSKSAVTTRDYNVQIEHRETLEEFVTLKHSPWNIDCSWSNEARELRELAVKSPWLIDEKFIMKFFKTLKIIDKQITEVDAGLLGFPNLKELTLSVNLLEHVNSTHLPPNLEVLELCANQIRNLDSLCVQPPPLLHLGLGYNHITDVDEYLTGHYWPKLLSIDLGFNHLSDLLDVVRKVSELPKLRNLVLQGNPLALVPGYRGYTIDSLKKLTILDDQRISADERHRFKGLAKKKEVILDEAKVTVSISLVKGVPMPEELQPTEDQPEFPVVTKTYHVVYEFVDDIPSTGVGLLLDDSQGFGPLDTAGDSVVTGLESPEPPPMSMEHSVREPIMEEPPPEMEEPKFPGDRRPVIPDVPPQTAESVEPPITRGSERIARDEPSIVVTTAEGVEGPLSDTQSNLPQEDMEEEPTQGTYTLRQVKTEGCSWAEAEIPMEYEQDMTVDNLLGLRDFLQKGLMISLIEEKVLSWPIDEDEERTNLGSKDKKREKSAKSDKGKGKDKDKGGKSGTSDKKKKTPGVELRHSPPETRVLGTYSLSLEQMLEGETTLNGEYTLEKVVEVKEVKEEETISDKKDKKSRGGKRARTPSAKKREKDKGKEKKPDSRKDSRDKKRPGSGAGKSDDEEEKVPPPPLTVQFKIKLHQWKTAADSMGASKTETRTETQLITAS
ncbi:DNAAF1 [Branchiostoma lanceolatum]|uniref:DNAAF1 protein n=1 Tax=Branchiostoma lanceolatum TaxID=7740 RepID=A0A8J9VV16_BRALA|nr:DNAAF1 [Branchiostoma lanceolatum]